MKPRKTRNHFRSAVLLLVCSLWSVVCGLSAAAQTNVYAEITITTSPTLALTNRAQRLLGRVRITGTLDAWYVKGDGQTNDITGAGMLLKAGDILELHGPDLWAARLWFATTNGTTTGRTEDFFRE